MSNIAIPDPIERLSRDLKQAARTLSDAEARFLVDAYYIIQEDRKRSGNQIRSMDKPPKGVDLEEFKKEPHEILDWFFEQSRVLENQIKGALDFYSESHEVGPWCRSIHGIGPVISAGLVAHIDIKQAPTAGHIWRYAGLDPTVEWKKGAKRPWNASLKVLCWKIGQSFMKQSGSEECFYGHNIYRGRKAYEIARNDSGGNAETAKLLIPKFEKTGRKTDALEYLRSGKLPPAQIDARARRYAVKMFLSHFQHVWYFIHFGEHPAKPYILTEAGGHAHEVKPPNTHMVPGFDR